MLSRCQLASHFSKTASSSFPDSFPVTRVSRTSRSGPRSSWLANSMHIRSFVGRVQNTDVQRSSKRSSHEAGSLWSEESWDQVFEDLDKSLPPTRPPPPLFSQPSRRQTMTERESKVLTGMLDMIFESKDVQEELGAKQPKEVSNGGDEGGIVRGQVDDLFSRLRRFSRRPKREMDASTELLDKKKEEMSLCTTDQQLLEWASREVFDESKRYEEAARNAMAEASATGTKTELPHLQPPIYPQLIAHLIRTFRVQFRDPNLALFVFNHAQNLSTVSYVFGCSTAAYNELIETRWFSFRDLEGVHAAIEEMDVNGIPFDSRTRKVVDTIRRELGSKEILREHSEDTHSESWVTLAKIERLLAPKLQPKRKSFLQWKAEVADFDEDDTFDDWSFGDLEKFSGRANPRAQPNFGQSRGQQYFNEGKSFDNHY